MQFYNYLSENYNKKCLILNDISVFIILFFKSNLYFTNYILKKDFFILTFLVFKLILIENYNKKKKYIQFLFFNVICIKSTFNFLKISLNINNNVRNKISEKILFSIKKLYNLRLKSTNQFVLKIEIVKRSIVIFRLVYNYIKKIKLKLNIYKNFFKFDKLDILILIKYQFIYLIRNYKNHKLFLNWADFFIVNLSLSELQFIKTIKTLIKKLLKKCFFLENLYYFYEKKAFKKYKFSNNKKKKNLILFTFHEKKIKLNIKYFILFLNNYHSLSIKLKNIEEFFYMKKIEFFNLSFFFVKIFKLIYKKIIKYDKNCNKEEKISFFTIVKFLKKEIFIKRSSILINFLKKLYTNSNIFFLYKNLNTTVFDFKNFLKLTLDCAFGNLSLIKNFHVFDNYYKNFKNLIFRAKDFFLDIVDMINFSFIKCFFTGFYCKLHFDCLKLEKLWFIYGKKILCIINNFLLEYTLNTTNKKTVWVNLCNFNEYKNRIYFNYFLLIYKNPIQSNHFLFSSLSMYQYIIYKELFKNIFILINFIYNLNTRQCSLMLLLFSKLLISSGQIGKAKVIYIMGIFFLSNNKKINTSSWNSFFFSKLFMVLFFLLKIF